MAAFRDKHNKKGCRLSAPIEYIILSQLSSVFANFFQYLFFLQNGNLSDRVPQNLAHIGNRDSIIPVYIGRRLLLCG